MSNLLLFTTMEERLIEKVSEHEALYNTDSPGYRDQRARNTAWREVGREMNIPASKCREIWAKLRNCYTNAIKRRLLVKKGQMPKKYPKWKYEDQMSFLVPYMVIKSNQESNSSDMSDGTYESQQESYLDESAHPGDEYRQHAFEIYPCSPAAVGIGVNVNAKRKKPTEITAEDMFQMLESNATLHKEKELKKQLDAATPTLDSTEMFYLSMARTVRRLPVIEQARIRMELCRLVSEAEIRCQHHFQTTTNQSLTNSHSTEHQQSDVQFNMKLK